MTEQNTACNQEEAGMKRGEWRGQNRLGLSQENTLSSFASCLPKTSHAWEERARPSALKCALVTASGSDELVAAECVSFGCSVLLTDKPQTVTDRYHYAFCSSLSLCFLEIPLWP